MDSRELDNILISNGIYNIDEIKELPIELQYQIIFYLRENPENYRSYANGTNDHIYFQILQNVGFNNASQNANKMIQSISTNKNLFYNEYNKLTNLEKIQLINFLEYEKKLSNTRPVPLPLITEFNNILDHIREIPEPIPQEPDPSRLTAGRRKSKRRKSKRRKSKRRKSKRRI